MYARNQEIEGPIPIPICNLGGVIVFASSDLLIWVTARSLKRGGGPDALTRRQEEHSLGLGLGGSEPRN